MRLDEFGREYPATLGEYRDLCAALGGEDCQAVAFLDEAINRWRKGRSSRVLVPHEQKWTFLLPLLTVPRKSPR